MKISIEGYRAYRDRKAYIDAGVQAAGGDCELLAPQPGSRVAGQPWAPLDFYSNILDANEQRKEAGNLGESDVFFAGDDHNRKAGQSDASWTRYPPAYLIDSFDFERPRRSRSWVSFYLGFTRGSLVYHGLVGVRAFRDGNDCTAVAYLCTHEVAGDDGIVNCAENGWTEELREVIAIADTIGGLRDRFRHIGRDRERHDISQLDVIVADSNGWRRERLAIK